MNNNNNMNQPPSYNIRASQNGSIMKNIPNSTEKNIGNGGGGSGFNNTGGSSVSNFIEDGRTTNTTMLSLN